MPTDTSLTARLPDRAEDLARVDRVARLLDTR